MKSFQIHFDGDGSLKIDNIKQAPGSQCVDLTMDYEKRLAHGESVNTVYLEDVNIASVGEIVEEST